MKDSFNADYYVAASAVIPILYLALTLQSSTFEGIVKRMGKSGAIPLSTLKSASYGLGLALMAIAGSAVILNGILALFGVFLVLYDRQSNHVIDLYELFSIMALLIFVVADPASRFARAYLRALSDLAKQAGSQAESQAESRKVEKAKQSDIDQKVSDQQSHNDAKGTPPAYS